MVVTQQPLYEILSLSIEGLLKYFGEALEEMFLVLQLLENRNGCIGEHLPLYPFVLLPEVVLVIHQTYHQATHRQLIVY
jgi:hypothetical protein